MTTASLPACLTRDNLTSPYFPSTSRAALANTAALAFIFVLTSLNRLNHTDLWCHLNYGRWIAEHAALPTADPFAAAPSDTPVLHTAWLAQLIGYQVQRLFGNEGLVLGHALLVTLTAGVLMLAVSRRGVPGIWAWAAGASFCWLDLPIVGTIRPQLFGQLGAALCLLACTEMPGRKHPLFWLPVVAALWANLHGSVVMGLAMLGFHAAGVAWTAYRDAQNGAGPVLRDRRVRIVAIALLLALAGACLNPHGLALLPRVLLFNEHAALAAIREWQSLRLASLTGILMIASVGLTAALAKFSPRKWPAGDVLMLAVFGLATVSAIRMLAWWAVVWPWVCVPHAAALWTALAKGKTASGQDDLPTSMNTVLSMGLIFATILIAPPTYSLVAGRGRGEGPIMVSDAPVYVADEMARRGIAGSIAAPMDWADYLVWKTNGRLKPLVHSHVHLSTSETWQDYETIFRGHDSWLTLLKARRIQYLLVSRQRFPKLARLVLDEDRQSSSLLRIIYQDQRCVLAKPRTD